MANVMSTEKRNTILRLMVEGNSVRSISRLMGSQIRTILRQLEWAGAHCRGLLDRKLVKLNLSHLECDEIHTFCLKKQARLTMDERAERHDIGDLYLFTAQDQATKLIASHLLGKRSADNTRRFMMGLRKRLAWIGNQFYSPVQISTDGFAAYPEAVDLAFGWSVKFGTIIKQYRSAKMRYDPGQIVGTKRTAYRGTYGPDKRSICTSHVERNNLTIRTFMRRFTRLALGFSKKLDNLQAAVDLHVAYFNFCWHPGTLGMTPAMAAGIAGHTWTFDELLAA
jgi:IS1 family transposase